jgi:predicted phage terminase large subunit-like protein
LNRRADIIRRLIAAKDAQNDLLTYVRLTMPDFKAPDDVRRSRYQVGRHHKVIANTLQSVAAGVTKYVIINCGPRHGKTELSSKKFMAWFSGLFPDLSLIFGTYNDTYAEDIGRAVRDNIMSPEHQLVFPDHAIKDGSASAKRLETTKGGLLAFVGRGGSITGRGGHGIIIDDPIKDRQEADSKLIRDQLWTWFTQVVMTRRMTTDAWVIIIQTRWHEDDMVGRLTDPMNPYYDPVEAAKWTVIDLPALAGDNDILGRKPGEALWPERFPVDFLLAQQRLDPRGFQALYQGRPSAEDGAFFRGHDIVVYKPDQLPKNLRYYCASDHAVSSKENRDKSCLLTVGVDENDNVWVMPDLVWRAEPTDRIVEQMIRLMAKYKPLFWWAERGAISKAIGPFLRKRMNEEKVFCSIVEVTPAVDKQARAQSIQGRMAMGKVMFPAQAPWWPEARDQLLKFPQSAHDDFVDALSYIGLGLSQQVSAQAQRAAKNYGRPGSYGHYFGRLRAEEARKRLERQSSGW